MTSLLVRIVLLSVFLSLAQNKVPAEVELTSEPSHHLSLQNQYVRVFQVEAAPHSATLLHRHRHDYIFVTLGPAQISNEVVGKTAVTLNLKDGEVRAADGNFAHIVRNLANTPFRNVTVELLQDEQLRSSPTLKWDEDRGMHILHGGTEEILFVKDNVRVSEVELQVAGVLPQHRHKGPHLLIAVTDLVLRSDVAGKSASNLEMKSGDVKWLAGGLNHTVTNVGAGDAKMVTLEFQ